MQLKNDVNIFFRPATSSFMLQLSSFLKFFKGTLRTNLKYNKFLANGAFYFMPVKLWYVWHFL